jgi:ATP/maltotriose-dependent transcriptional regulator MalT
VAELQRREPDLAPTLHRRASVWFEQADMPDQAIEHALAAGDAHRAAMLLAGSAKTLMAELRYTSIRRILDRLPPEERGSFGPFCEALDLQCMIAEGVDQRIVAERAEALAELHGGDPRVREFADVVLATPYHGDVRRALEVARARWQSLADKPDERQRIAPDYAFTLWWAGRHEEAREVTEPNLRVEQPLQFTVWTRAQLALCAADARNGDLAERYARDAMTIVEEAGAATAVEFTAVPAILAEALRVQGKLAEARRYLSPALEAEATRPGSVGHAFALVFDAQLALAEGNRRRAQTSARRARAIVDRLPDLGTIAARLRTVEAALEERPANPLLDTHPSPAEMRVLVLLDSDRTFAEIADELFVSAHTVTSHAQRLYRRLGVANRRDAVQAAHRRGFLPAGSGGDGGP